MYKGNALFDEVDAQLNEWGAQLQEDSQQLEKLEQKLEVGSEQKIMECLRKQGNKISELRMYEETSASHSKALRQLIEEKQSSQEKQLEFIKQQHQHDINLLNQQFEESMVNKVKTITQLIDEKKQLADQLDDLFAQVQKEKTQNTMRMNKLKQAHDNELSQQKQQFISREKRDRDKWQKEKTHQIRELTIKGLEPELHNLVQKHQLEIEQIKLEYQQKLFQQKNDLQLQVQQSSLFNIQQIQQQLKQSSVFIAANNQLTINPHNIQLNSVQEQSIINEQLHSPQQIPSLMASPRVIQTIPEETEKKTYQSKQNMSNIFAPSSNQMIFQPPNYQLSNINRLQNSVFTPHIKTKSTKLNQNNL